MGSSLVGFMVQRVEPRALSILGNALYHWATSANPVCLFWREVLDFVLFLFFNHSLSGNLKVTMPSSLAHT